MPILLFACFCFAIKTHIELMTRKINNINNFLLRPTRKINSQQNCLEIFDILESTRITYHRLMDIIKCTNIIFGPIIFSCVLEISISLPLFTYATFYQSSKNRTLLIFKLIFGFTWVLRLAFVCLFADSFKYQVNNL